MFKLNDKMDLSLQNMVGFKSRFDLQNKVNSTYNYLI